MKWITVAALAFAALVLLSACDDDEDNGGAQTVDVTLNEFVVTPGPASTASGDVTFLARNIGADEHELVVVKTDLAADALPAAADGSFDEEAEGVQVIDEIEDVAPGTTKEITVNLNAGKYVLLCNLVEQEDGETEAHYAEGMRAAFTVE